MRCEEVSDHVGTNFRPDPLDPSGLDGRGSGRAAGGNAYAVDSPRGQARVALAADHLIAVVLGGKGLERGLDDATTETEDQVERRLLLDVVVGQGAAILELLAREDETLLVRGDALLVLDLGLDVVCTRILSAAALLRKPRDSVGTIFCLSMRGPRPCSVRGRGEKGLRTDGVRRLHLKGDGLARDCEKFSIRSKH